MTRILVVDDEKSIRVTFQAMLADAGFEVCIAEDAETALEICRTDKINIVVSDIIMPRMTGIALLKRLRKVSPSVRVILMTGEPTVETAAEGVRHNAFDYLIKPVNKVTLLDSVNKVAQGLKLV